MKEVQKINSDTVEIVKQVQQKKIKHIGSTLINDGHKIFEFNKQTFEVKIAKYETTARFTLNNSQPKKELIVKENCYYIASLNIKNAIKKLKKIFNNTPYFVVTGE